MQLTINELRIEAFTFVSEGGGQFCETIELSSARHNCFLLINRWGIMAKLNDSSASMASYRHESADGMVKQTQEGIRVLERSGYEQTTRDTTFQAHPQNSVTDKEIDRRVNYLSERGIIKVFNEGGGSEICRFFRGCGIETAADMGNFLLGGLLSDTDEAEPVIQKPKPANWGTW